jgi:hypothetical protein
MLASNVSLTTVTHAGGGGGQRQPAKREITADGQRVIAFMKSLPAEADGSKRQAAAVGTAFMRYGFTWPDFCPAALTHEEFEHVEGGNNPPRYDPHTGLFFTLGEDDSDKGKLICTDQSLLVAKAPKQPRTR